EMRSGRPWPGVVRVPWRTWQSNLPRALALLDPAAAAQPLPRTASEVERFEKARVEFAQATRLVGNAAICTASRATFESIADALIELGIFSHWQSAESELPLPSVDLVVFDGWEQVSLHRQLAACSGLAPTPQLL